MTIALSHCSPWSLYCRSTGAPNPWVWLPLYSSNPAGAALWSFVLSIPSLWTLPLPHICVSHFLHWHSFSNLTSPLHRCLLCPPVVCWSQLISACRKFPDLVRWCRVGSQNLHQWESLWYGISKHCQLVIPPPFSPKSTAPHLEHYFSHYFIFLCDT